MFKRSIVINATALDTGGGLTILKQFIEVIPEDEFNYLIFIPSKTFVENHQTNIRLINVDTKSFLKRLMWDAFGLKKYLKKNSITPISALSLQNTNFRVGYKIPNYIYYHQPIPFFDNSWSLFDSKQRYLWFYKHIYPLFVILFVNERTEFFVQLEFIKTGFEKKFRSLKNKIHVNRPKVNFQNKVIDNSISLDSNTINLFYPASPYLYKNHVVIIEAISKLKDNKIRLYLTCKRDDIKCDIDFLDIKFMGSVSYDDVLSMYKACDALLFPSYIETFGLPLIEAASLGTPIIAADLPYAKEVLNSYEGVDYVDFKDVEKWVVAISKIKKNEKFKPLSVSKTDSWEELLKILKRNIKNYDSQ